MSDQNKRPVYISGPISAEIPHTTREERKSRFYKAEAFILEHRPGWEPVNPLKVEACTAPDAVKCYMGLEDISTHTWECWLRYDLKALLGCYAIVMLPGWDRSQGAHLEAMVARAVGMHVYFANIHGEVYA